MLLANRTQSIPEQSGSWALLYGTRRNRYTRPGRFGFLTSGDWNIS